MTNIQTGDLNHLIRSLEDALVVAKGVKEGDVFDYAYVNGYSKSCMEQVKHHLESINATGSNDNY